MAEIQGFPVIDDSYTNDHENGTGYEGRDLASFPLNSLKCAAPGLTKRLSRKEILEAIDHKTANKSWISDQCDRVGSKVKNQQASSYCWIHAPTRGMEVQYVLSGGKQFTLSAFWAGATIKGGWNQGGSGIVGVQFLAEHGTCLEEMFPPMTFRGYDRQELKDNALLHRITKWEEFDPGDHDMIASSIIADQGVTVGIPAWTHEVFLSFLIRDGNDYKFGFDNSWKYTWGNNGRGVLTGAKTRFDEAGRVADVTAAIA